jgi:hypothetical protein
MSILRRRRSLPKRASVIPSGSDWYLAAGVENSAVIAAWRPYQAASLAESLVNLAHPGTHDAAVGNAPGLGANGWIMNAASLTYLTTGIVVVGIDANVPAYSAIIRYTGMTLADYGYLFGGFAGAEQGFGICPSGDTNCVYRNGGAGVYPDYPGNEAILSFGEQFAYRNGVLEFGSPISESNGLPIPSLYIGALNTGAGAEYHVTCTISHLAIYEMTLEEFQLDEVYDNILADL